VNSKFLELEDLIKEEEKIKKLIFSKEEEYKEITKHNELIEKRLPEVINKMSEITDHFFWEYLQKNKPPQHNIFTSFITGSGREYDKLHEEYIEKQQQNSHQFQLYAKELEELRKKDLKPQRPEFIFKKKEIRPLKERLSDIRVHIRQLKQEERNKEADERNKKLEAKRQEKDAKLARYEKESRRQAKYLVSEIKKEEQENWKCPYCNKGVDLNLSHVDHIYPVSKGGLSVKENMVLICEKCNLKKGDGSLRSFCKKEKFTYSKVCERLENLGKFI